MLPGSVALTYDGGPDPAWTPRLLDLLREHHAKATFFLTGTEAAAHPDLVRRIKDEGHEIGSHTYTDADLGSVSGIRAGLELSLTQNTLAGTAGVGTPLLRLPHTSTTESLCGEQWRPGGAPSSTAMSWSQPMALGGARSGAPYGSSPARPRP